MKFIASLFKILFILPFFRKRYFWFYKRIFKPKNLFQGISTVRSFESGLKIKLDLDEWIQQHIYFLGSWDPRGMNFLRNYLKQGDVFFDIGANIGTYTLVASRIVGETGVVHSFEAITDVYHRMVENIELNKLNNITPNHRAVYQHSQMLEFFVSSKENAGMSSIFHHDTESGKLENVQAVSIDEYIESGNISRVDMIKIDIEGAELFALKGMTTTLERFHPVLIMEVSDDVLKNTGISGNEILELLTGMGYVRKKIYKCGHTGDPADSKTDYHNFAFFHQES